LQTNLAGALSPWGAVSAQAVLFAVWGALLGAAGSLDRVLLFFSFSLALGALRVVTGSLWAPIGFHLVFQSVAQYLGAAQRDGALVVDGRDVLDVVVLWFFPIAVGTVVLVLVGARRGIRWSRRDTDQVPA
jgi:CAAX protease family protein